MKDIFSKLMFNIPKWLHELHNNLPSLPERMTIGRFEMSVTNLHDKTEYVTQIRNLKQALNQGLILKKVHWVTKFNQKALIWIHEYTDMNTKVRQKAKNYFGKLFFQIDE